MIKLILPVTLFLTYGLLSVSVRQAKPKSSYQVALEEFCNQAPKDASGCPIYSDCMQAVHAQAPTSEQCPQVNKKENVFSGNTGTQAKAENILCKADPRFCD